MKKIALIGIIVICGGCGLFHDARGPYQNNLNFKGIGLLLFSVQIPQKMRVEKSYLTVVNSISKIKTKIPFIGTIAPGNAIKRIFQFPLYDWRFKTKGGEGLYVSAKAIVLSPGRYRIKNVVFDFDSRYNYKLNKRDVLKRIIQVNSSEFVISKNIPLYCGRFSVSRKLPASQGPLRVEYTIKVTDNYPHDRELFLKKYKNLVIKDIKTKIVSFSIQ